MRINPNCWGVAENVESRRLARTPEHVRAKRLDDKSGSHYLHATRSVIYSNSVNNNHNNSLSSVNK